MLKKSLIISFLALLFDQTNKFITLDFYESRQQSFFEITPFFNLVMVWNHGISFGILRGGLLPYQPYILAIMAIIISGFVLAYAKKSTRKYEAVACGLIAGGAISNVIDRLIYGAVADFFDFHVAGFHWPAFNFADSFICIGVFMLVVDGIFGKSKPHEK